MTSRYLFYIFNSVLVQKPIGIIILHLMYMVKIELPLTFPCEFCLILCNMYMNALIHTQVHRREERDEMKG
jgi:hypothetical protein